MAINNPLLNVLNPNSTNPVDLLRDIKVPPQPKRFGDKFRNMTPEKQQKWASALYLLGGALKGNDMSQDMATLQRNQAIRKAEADAARLNATIDGSNLNAAQKELAKANPALFAKYQFESQFSGGAKDTTLITNNKYINDLYKERDKYEVNSAPYNDLSISIRNAEAATGAYKYDTSRQSELTYGKTAAEQGRLGKSVLSKGELKSDEAFGTWYTNEWLLKGGGSTEQTYLESLKGVRNTLADAEQSGESISGVGQGILSKYPTAQAYFNPEGAVVQDRIASVAQLSLKAILGGQFSEREGELLIQRAYNPLLSEAENIERLTQLINRIEKAENYKKSAVDYWEENKSMSGFKAPKYGEEEFRSDIESYYRQDMKLLSDDALRAEFMRVPEDSIYFEILSEEYKKRNG